MFARHADTDILIKLLAKAKPGDLVSYEDLDEAIGTSVRNNRYGCLQSARKHLLREKRKVFTAVYNEGLRCLDDVGKVDTFDGVRRQLGRAARRGRQIQLSVEHFDRLPAGHQRKHNVAVALLAAMDQASKPTSVKKLERKVTDLRADEKLSVARTLKALEE